jgi:hypothetical protein
MIVAVVTDVYIPEPGADKAWVVIDVVFICAERDISIVRVIVLNTTEPYRGRCRIAINLGGLA